MTATKSEKVVETIPLLYTKIDTEARRDSAVARGTCDPEQPRRSHLHHEPGIVRLMTPQHSSKVFLVCKIEDVASSAMRKSPVVAMWVAPLSAVSNLTSSESTVVVGIRRAVGMLVVVVVVMVVVVVVVVAAVAAAEVLAEVAPLVVMEPSPPFG